MFKNLKNLFNTAKNTSIEKIDFLDEDIYAVLSLLIEASKIDGEIDKKEIMLIENLLIKKFNLDKNKVIKSIDHVINESFEKTEIYSDIKVILDNMDHEERISVVEMLWRIILADDKIDDYEANLMRRITGMLHLSGFESAEAKKRAQN